MCRKTESAGQLTKDTVGLVVVERSPTAVFVWQVDCAETSCTVRTTRNLVRTDVIDKQTKGTWENKHNSLTSRANACMFRNAKGCERKVTLARARTHVPVRGRVEM